MPEWYSEWRAEMKRAFATPVSEAKTEHVGGYAVTIETLEPMGYSRARVARQGAEVCVVERNYSHFPYRIVSHANGHDYFLCGEDYQGLTAVELDTGRRVDWIPEEAKSGGGFCHVGFHASPGGRLVAAEGCFWACPYDVRVYNFRDPMALPWPLLENFEEAEELAGWAADGLHVKCIERVRAADGKRWHDLTDAERRQLNEGPEDNLVARSREYLVGEDGSKKVLSDKPGVSDLL